MCMCVYIYNLSLYRRCDQDDLGLEEIEGEPPTSNVVRRQCAVEGLSVAHNA